MARKESPTFPRASAPKAITVHHKELGQDVKINEEDFDEELHEHKQSARPKIEVHDEGGPKHPAGTPQDPIQSGGAGRQPVVGATGHPNPNAVPPANPNPNAAAEAQRPANQQQPAAAVQK